jgi:hypothetical protein
MSKGDDIDLTQRIIDTVGPLIDGKEFETVIDAFASATVGLLAACRMNSSDARDTLYAYAARIRVFADDPATQAWIDIQRLGRRDR